MADILTSERRQRWLSGLIVLYAAVSPVSLSATNIALGIIILAGSVSMYSAKAVDKEGFHGKLIVLMSLLFLWSALTRLLSGSPLDKEAVSNVWEYIPVILLPVFFNVSNVKKDRVITVLLISSSIVCFLGILQYFIPSIVYPFPKQMIREHFKGFFSHHLHSGGFYSMTIILALSLGLFWKCSDSRKMYLWLFFILNLAGLVLTMARSYLISVPLIMLLLLYVKNWRWFASGIAALAVTTALLLTFPNPVKIRFETLLDPEYRSNKERVLMWKAAINMAKDHPVVGIGKGNWTKEAKERYFPPIEKEYDYKIIATAHAHNTYLTVLAETGIVGILLFTAFWLSVAWGLFSKLSTLQNGCFDYVLIIGTLGSLGNLFVAGMFENNFGTSVILLLLSFLIGLSLVKGEGVAAE